MSQTAIQRVQSLNGKITSVYHTKLGLQVLVNPEKFPIQPYFEAPVLDSDVSYYSSAHVNGYLSDKQVFEQDFQPRGYLSEPLPKTVELEAIQEPTNESSIVLAAVRKVNPVPVGVNISEKLKELEILRQKRIELYEKAKKVEEQNKVNHAWNLSNGYLYNGDIKWVNVSPLRK